MTAALIALAVSNVVLAGVILGLFRSSGRERSEWAGERRSLVDRAIARHAGEALALDRSARPSVKPGPLDHAVERPVSVGL